MLVIADLKINLQKHYVKERMSYRNITNIDLNQFKLYIQKSDLITAAELCNQFHKTLESLIDCHARLITKAVSQQSHNPSRKYENDSEKRKRRQLESDYQRIMGYCKQHRAQKGYDIYARFINSIPHFCSSFFNFLCWQDWKKNRLKYCTDNDKPQFIPPLKITSFWHILNQLPQRR